MELINNLKALYKRGDIVIRLIFINLLIFLVLKILLIIFELFKIDFSMAYGWLALPSNLQALLYKPWTLITYMFLHQDFFHLFFNMLALYWFGKIFLLNFTEKQLFGTYFFGGLLGGIVFLISYNTFPLYREQAVYSMLLGASASVIAIILAAAMQNPQMEIRLLLIGRIKLIYIAAITVLISILGITSHNSGGQLAHLGGALYGYLFIISLRSGKDLTKGFNSLMDRLSNLFRPRGIKTRRTKSKQSKMTDAEFNQAKAQNMKEIDRILDKIKSSGYSSLTTQEKKKLFDQGNYH